MFRTKEPQEVTLSRIFDGHAVEVTCMPEAQERVKAMLDAIPANSSSQDALTRMMHDPVSSATMRALDRQ